MPRRARLALAQIPWHIVQRGNNRAACFFEPADYRHFLEDLRELAEPCACEVHAYVLMTNHVHLVLTPATTTGPAQLMKALEQRHAQYINRRYGRTGTLWQGRFRSSIVQSDAYVLACCRYVELNPVRAGMVKDPSDYRWSSYRANGAGEFSPIIRPCPAYLALAPTLDERLQTYRALFGSHAEAEALTSIRVALNANAVLGEANFVAAVSTTLGRHVLKRPVGRPARR